jgi:hypothetical protein
MRPRAGGSVAVVRGKTHERRIFVDAAQEFQERSLMPRPTVGHVVQRPWADGATISFGAKVRAYGRYEKVTFGTNK